MINLPILWKASKRGKEKGSFCTACYASWGIIFNGDTVKIDKCMFCNG
jgi:hypothetical protein